MSVIACLLTCFALLVVRAFALAAETALLACSKEDLQERKVPPEKVAVFSRLKERPEATFGALRAFLVLDLSVAAAFAAIAGQDLLGPWASARLLEPWAGLPGPLAGGTGIALLATLFDLPARSLATARAVDVAVRWAPQVWLLVRVSRGPLGLLTAVLDRVLRPLGGRATLVPPRPPLEDLERLLLEEANRQGLDPQGPKLIRNIFEMSEKTARDVMVQRTEVVAVEVGTPPEQILQLLAEHGHSRMPVYREQIDRVLGVLHTRDLVPMLQHPELIVLQDTLRPAHFIPWSKPVGEILREMQKKKIQMALVVDEYGGFLGVVTLEDVLEVIVGDIQDEYDDDEHEVETLADGSSVVRASMALDTFALTFGIERPEDAGETVGGLLNHLAGCIPEVADEFVHQGLRLTVQDRTPRRVKRVRVQRVAAPAKGLAG